MTLSFALTLPGVLSIMPWCSCSYSPAILSCGLSLILWSPGIRWRARQEPALPTRTTIGAKLRLTSLGSFLLFCTMWEYP